MLNEQRIRGILFYLSVAIFFIGLPFILSYALGYKFNLRTFKFTKTGLLVIKTYPEGADIFLNYKLLNEKTPATIRELLPGEYNLSLALNKHYPWSGKVGLEAGRVTLMDKIILFPLRPNIKQLNKDKISSFWVDQEDARVYYFNRENNVIYSSNLEGENFEEIGILPQDFSLSRKWKISKDQEKLVGFNPRQVIVVYLKIRDRFTDTEPLIILEDSAYPIVDIFWHSDNYHLILITDRNIGILEARLQAKILTLVNLNKKNTIAFYDDNNDALYFTDAQKASDGRWYDNVYKLELSTKSFPFQELIKPKSDE